MKIGAEGSVPECIGCGESNYVAHNVAICAACVSHARRSDVGTHDIRSDVMQRKGVAVFLTHFEASMVLCVLAVAKSGDSRYDTADLPLRREALSRSYAKLSAVMGVANESEGTDV